MRHRIANSLQIIASILLLKADVVESKESRSHLAEAHERIMSIAALQQNLDPVSHGDNINIGNYLKALCENLARSMIGDRKPITLEVIAGAGSVSSDTAISFGLMVTELVINSLKHGFPDSKPGKIIVRYKTGKSGWVLSIEDNGVGKDMKRKTISNGLGTSIVGALANQMHAVIRTKASTRGTKVSVVHENV